MPKTIRRAEESVPNREGLFQALLAEWNRPEGQSGPAGAPSIEITEGQRQFGVGRSLHVRVVWDAWQALDTKDRADLVVDTFQEYASQDDAEFSPEDLLRITLLEALTVAEADRPE